MASCPKNRSAGQRCSCNRREMKIGRACIPCSPGPSTTRQIVHVPAGIRVGSGAAVHRTTPGIRIKVRSGSLGSLAVVVVQEPAETFASMHCALEDRRSWVRTDQCLLQTWVVALGMIMRDEFGSRFPHRPFAEPDHPLPAGFLDGPYQPLGVGVQIGTPRRATSRRPPRHRRASARTRR